MHLWTIQQYLLKLRKHDFIAKEQAAFLVEKSSLQEGEIVVLGDFAENYSFVIQDAVQGFHWNNTQATIHPFVAYYYDAVRGEVCFLNFVIISDSLTHDSVAVHCFVKKLLTFLVTKLTVKKVYYFSDGAASQYKNKKNFVNLAFHNRDFKNIEAEWHFFATAHGKGPCDGLGGTVKREAVSTSLKRPLEGQIQTPQELSEWAKDAIPSVTFEFVDKNAAVTIEGTQSYHAYYKLKDCTNKLMVKTYSRSLSSEIVQISNHREPIPIDDVGGKDDILIVSHADILRKANPTTTTGRVYDVSSEEAETASRTKQSGTESSPDMCLHVLHVFTGSISATAGVEAAELSNEAKDKVLQRSVALPQARSLLKEEHEMLPGQQSPTVEMPDSCSSKLQSELQCKGLKDWLAIHEGIMVLKYCCWANYRLKDWLAIHEGIMVLKYCHQSCWANYSEFCRTLISLSAGGVYLWVKDCGEHCQFHSPQKVKSTLLTVQLS
eukprot:Em0008g511a